MSRLPQALTSWQRATVYVNSRLYCTGPFVDRFEKETSTTKIRRRSGKNVQQAYIVDVINKWSQEHWQIECSGRRYLHCRSDSLLKGGYSIAMHMVLVHAESRDTQVGRRAVILVQTVRGTPRVYAVAFMNSTFKFSFSNTRNLSRATALATEDSNVMSVLGAQHDARPRANL